MTSVKLEEIITELLVYGQTFTPERVIIKPTIFNKFRKEFFSKIINDTYFNNSTIFLPTEINHFDDKKLNREFYKHLLLQSIAHIKYKSFESEFEENNFKLSRIFGNSNLTITNYKNLEELFNSFSQPQLAEDLFNIFEDFRVNKLLLDDYSGLTETFEIFNRRIPTLNPEKWSDGSTSKMRVLEMLNLIYASHFPEKEVLGENPLVDKNQKNIILDAVEIANSHIKDSSFFESSSKVVPIVSELSDLLVGEGIYFPIELSSTRIDKNINKKLTQAKRRERQIIKELGVGGPRKKGSFGTSKRRGFGGKGRGLVSDDEDNKKRPRIENGIRLDEIESNISDELIASLGDVRKGDGFYADALNYYGVESYPNQYGYSEFDSQLGMERTLWVRLIEAELGHSPRWERNPMFDESSGGISFYENVRNTNLGLIKRLERKLEQMRSSEFVHDYHRTDGEELDIDALVEYLAEKELGVETSDEPPIYIKNEEVIKSDSMAVGMLVGMNISSRNNEIIDRRRESSILLTQALDSMGVSSGVYGISGRSRGVVEFYPVKEFDMKLDDRVKTNFGKIVPQDYARTGAGIRHLSKKLFRRPEDKKILIVHSDVPEDITWGEKVPSYRDDYALLDVSNAVEDARKLGIQVIGLYNSSDSVNDMGIMYGPQNIGYVDELGSFVKHIETQFR